MRRILIVCVVVTMCLAPAAAENSVSAGLGANFFRYDTTYLTAIAANYQHELRPDLELNIGGEFGITTDEDADGDTVPSFLIPVNIGLNFAFPVERTTFLFGTGLTPVFNINPDTDDEFEFYMGPYVKGAMRLRVHPIMSWFVEVQQDLLIGGDDWINVASRVSTGINFTLTSGSPAGRPPRE